MMISASLGLLWEGMDTADIPGKASRDRLTQPASSPRPPLLLCFTGFFGYQPFWRVMPGFVLGVLNILLTKRLLAKYDHDALAVPHMKVQDVRKVILIVSACLLLLLVMDVSSLTPALTHLRSCSCLCFHDRFS